MKRLFEQNETIITTEFVPDVIITDEIKEGDIIPHKEFVGGIFFYNHEYDAFGRMYLTKVNLDRNYILELAEKIKQIESNSVDMEYSSLPF